MDAALPVVSPYVTSLRALSSEHHIPHVFDFYHHFFKRPMDHAGAPQEGHVPHVVQPSPQFRVLPVFFKHIWQLDPLLLVSSSGEVRFLHVGE